MRKENYEWYKKSIEEYNELMKDMRDWVKSIEGGGGKVCDKEKR